MTDRVGRAGTDSLTERDSAWLYGVASAVTGDVCVRCPATVTFDKTGLCPACVRRERRERRTRRREPQPAVEVLPGQIDIFEVLEGEGSS